MTNTLVRRRRRIRKIALDIQGGLCFHCGNPLTNHEATFDHFIPSSLGGAEVLSNCVASHYKCNRRKGDTIPSLFDIARFQLTNGEALWTHDDTGLPQEPSLQPKPHLSSSKSTSAARSRGSSSSHQRFCGLFSLSASSSTVPSVSSNMEISSEKSNYNCNYSRGPHSGWRLLLHAVLSAGRHCVSYCGWLLGWPIDKGILPR